MRNKQPVTDVETLLPEGEYIYSRTCTRGVIEEANEAFASISGYRQEEVHASVTLANSTEEALGRVNDEMGSTLRQVVDIAHAAEEQQTALQELTQSIESISAMADQSVATVTQTTAMVESLKAVEARMNKAVRQYVT